LANGLQRAESGLPSIVLFGAQNPISHNTVRQLILWYIANPASVATIVMPLDHTFARNRAASPGDFVRESAHQTEDQ
jgi:hypothetical protein